MPKSYISGEQLYPPIVTSLVACFSLGMMSPSGNNANRPTLFTRDDGNIPGYALSFAGGQGLFIKSLNAQGWNGIGNIAIFTCFIVTKYNKPNSAATGREACISFDPPSLEKPSTRLITGIT